MRQQLQKDCTLIEQSNNAKQGDNCGAGFFINFLLLFLLKSSTTLNSLPSTKSNKMTHFNTHSIPHYNDYTQHTLSWL